LKKVDFTPESIEQMISYADQDGDHLITFDEFSKVMMYKPPV